MRTEWLTRHLARSHSSVQQVTPTKRLTVDVIAPTVTVAVPGAAGTAGILSGTKIHAEGVGARIAALLVDWGHFYRRRTRHVRVIIGVHNANPELTAGVAAPPSWTIMGVADGFGVCIIRFRKCWWRRVSDPSDR